MPSPCRKPMRQTVLGEFQQCNASLTPASPRPSSSATDKFYVNTDGPDGKLEDYEIKYTFGVRPLQQYLIEFPGGRLQALGIAWDSRPKEEGGQRWFHLYPGQKLTFRDPLHWTGIDQNWNYQCAECHSTHLKKRYDAKTAVYDTTWSEINVSCESCHGPGSDHVDVGEEKPGQEENRREQWTCCTVYRASRRHVGDGRGQGHRTAQPSAYVEIVRSTPVRVAIRAAAS